VSPIFTSAKKVENETQSSPGSCTRGSSPQCRVIAGGAQWRTCDCMNINDPNDCHWSQYLPCPHNVKDCCNDHCCPTT